MATTKAQEGKLSEQRASTPTQPRGFSCGAGLTIRKGQADRAFLSRSLVGAAEQLQTRRHSPSAAGGGAGPAGCPGAEARGGFPSAAPRSLSGPGPQSVLPCAREKGPAAPQGPGICLQCTGDPNLCLWAYRSTIKHIPSHFFYLLSICSVSYVVPSSSWPTLCLPHHISPYWKPSAKSNKRVCWPSTQLHMHCPREKSPLLCAVRGPEPVFPDFPSFCLDFLFLPHSLPFLCVSLTSTFRSEASRSVGYAGTYRERPHGHSWMNQVSRSRRSCSR